MKLIRTRLANRIRVSSRGNGCTRPDTCITRFRRIDSDESFASLMGPVMSSLPVRQTPGSASVDGHSSFPLRERSCPMGSGCNICSQVSPAGYLLLSVVSAKAASMMRLERSGETIYECVVRQMTTNCEAYVFTTSTVPATGPRGARTPLPPLSDSLFLHYRSL
jgi:hypothetical protein